MNAAPHSAGRASVAGPRRARALSARALSPSSIDQPPNNRGSTSSTSGGSTASVWVSHAHLMAQLSDAVYAVNRTDTPSEAVLSAKIKTEVERAGREAGLGRGALTVVQVATPEQWPFVAVDERDASGAVVARHVVCRGVSMRDADVWLGPRLGRALPRQISPGDGVVCHAGVLDLAEHLFDAGGVRALVEELPPTAKLSFAGHSLGGSIACAFLALARLRLRFPSERLLPCCTFGSPPVLALDFAAPTASDDVTSTLGLPGRDFLQAFVLKSQLVSDPVPRLWLTADPFFGLMESALGLSALLDWRSTPREALPSSSGARPILSRERFLFQTCGTINLITSSAAGTRCEELATADEALDALRARPEERTPAGVLRSLLCHSRRAYAASLAALHAESRAASTPSSLLDKETPRKSR